MKTTLKMEGAILFFLMLHSTFLFAQTGPAGIGTNDGSSTLKLWYRPDFGISTTGTSVDSWQNGAGVAAHDLVSAGTNRPTLVNTAVNGYDELSYDGNDYLETTGALTTTNFITDQASSFVVTQRTGISANWVYATFPHQADRFSCHISWSNGTVYWDIGGCCGTQTRIQVGGLGSLANYSYWSYDASNALGKQLYRNGSLLQNRANTQNYTSHASHSFRIGQVLNGNITEVIIYNQRINSAQRIIVENYLSAKYDIVPAANDLYDEDNAGNGNYDFDVAGIGQVDATNTHADSRGTGIVRILNPSDLNDDEFLIWGHDGGDQQATEKTDIPSGIDGRFERVWRVSEVNMSSAAVDVGSVDIRWDLTGLGNVTASDLRLLIDTDNDGFFADETPITGAVDLGGDVYEFSAQSGLQNNLRFTLATINSNSTPLPIELMSFTGQVNSSNDNLLKWSTATEMDNSHFVLEHSRDALNWKAIDELEGSGNSLAQRDYQSIHLNPESGVNYYRLIQFDYDLDSTISHVVRIHNRSADIDFELYPNPTRDVINLVSNQEIEELPLLFDRYGKSLNPLIQFASNSKYSVQIDLSELAKGTYFLRFANKTELVVKE